MLYHACSKLIPDGCTEMGIAGIPRYWRVFHSDGVEDGDNTAVAVLPRNWGQLAVLSVNGIRSSVNGCSVEGLLFLHGLQ